MEEEANDHAEPTGHHHDYLMHKNSRFKGTEPQYHQQQETLTEQKNSEKVLNESRSGTSMNQTEYEDDGEEEGDDDNKFKLDEMRCADARMGICSVCHSSIRGSNVSPTDFEKALLCSDGHLLCHRCVQRFAIQSDTSCVLCAATESQQSITSVSRTSSVKSTRPKRRPHTPAPRGHREQRRNKVDKYGGSTTVSHTNISSHYNIGINIDVDSCDDHYYDTEHEDEIEQKSPRAMHEMKRRSYGSLTQKEELTSAAKTQINEQMMSECSRRPIQCPRLDCAVNVAFSALTNHFIFDHPEVPILSVDPGEKSTLIVNFDGLSYDSSRCLALLLVSGKLSGPAARQFNGSHIHPSYKNRLPLPILAARLHCNASYDGAMPGDSGNDDGRDVIIAWVAGLDIGNSTTALRCSIQAIDSIDSEAFRSLTYTGPINSLRTAQKPREVFHTGDCVILHDGFINHITSGYENLNVNVIIH